MVSGTSLDAYRSHELTIQMKTSSGDTLSLNFENTQQLSMSSRETDSSKEQSFSFSSLQAFSFKMESNGISEQDQKEINDFMKQAQPYIDRFMKELNDQKPTTPINKIASDITSSLGDLKHKSEAVQNVAKNGIVNLFDNAIKETKPDEKIVSEAQKLLQKILDGFRSTLTPIYA